MDNEIEEPAKFQKPPYFTKHSRNIIDLRTMSSTKPFLRTPFPTHKKKPPPHYRFHYDPDVKGWRESQLPTATTRWNKAKGAVRVGNYFIGIRKKPDTFLNIDLKKLVNAAKQKRTIQSARTMHECKVGEDSELGSLESYESVEIDVERTLTEPTILSKPFLGEADRPSDGVWSCPASIKVSKERTKQFVWERPKPDKKALVESASKYQAIYLQKLLKEKDREVKLITNQLIKSNKENVALLKELEGYRGKNYDELYKENITLKEQLARACRENAVLAGQKRREDNRTLQKFGLV